MSPRNYRLEFERERSASKLNWNKLCALLVIIFASTSILVAIPHPSAATPVNQSSSANLPSSINAATPSIFANFTFNPTDPDVDVPVYFDASSSYAPTSFITVYQWSWGDGSLNPPVIPIESSNYRTTTHAFQLNGTFTVTLTIVDNNGATATTSRNITVKMINSNTPPAALFTYAPTKPIINEMVKFDATASRDPDGDTVTSYYWTGGAPANASGGITPGTQFNASGIVFTHTFTATGVYVISLTVTDNLQLSSSQYTLIAVTRIPYLPGVKAGDYGKYYFSSNQTSNSGLLAVLVNVTQVSGTKVGSSFSVQFPNGTIFFATNQTTDVYSGLGFGNFFITVVAANLTAGDGLFSYLGSFLRFNYTATKVIAGASREVTGLTYGAFGSGTISLEYDRLTGLLVYLAFAFSGQSTEIFLGDTNAWAARGNEAPLPLFYWSPGNPSPGQAVSFDASRSYDPDHDSPLSYAWTFGDGGTAVGTLTSHTYIARGNYTVTLTVSDPARVSTSARKAIMVGRYVPGSVSIVDDGRCTVNDSACHFVPSLLNVSVGALVIWANNGALLHNVSSCSSQNNPPAGACPVMNVSALQTFSQTLAPGQTFSQTLTTAGTYYYYCAIHPWMHGTVIVAGGPPADFQISANPSALLIPAGQMKTSAITLQSINNFNGTVTLVAGSGTLAVTFNPIYVPLSPNGLGYSTMTVSVPPGTPIGNYHITVYATSRNISHATDVSVATGQLISPSITSVSQITTNTRGTIAILGSGFGTFPPTQHLSDGSVDTGVNGTSPSIAVWDNLTQSGWTWQAGHWGNAIGIYITSWSDTQIVLGGFGSALGPGTRDSNGVCRGTTPWTICLGDSITIGVWGPNNSGPSYYNLTVAGSTQGDFSISAFPSSVLKEQGTTFSINLVFTSTGGFSGTISYDSTLSAPPGVNQEPGGVSIPPNGNASLVIKDSVPLSAAPGNYTFTTKWTSGTVTHAISIPVTIVPRYSQPHFSLSVSPSLLTIPQGSSRMATVILQSLNGYSGTVRLYSFFSGLPTSLGFAGTSVSLTAGQTAYLNFTISPSSSATPSDYTVDVEGFNGTGNGGPYDSTSASVIVTSANLHGTTTTVVCPGFFFVGAPTTCTATVTDNGQGPSTPSGTVAFSSDSPGSFTGSPCTLYGSGSTATCSVSYTPSAVGSGSHTISAAYSGDAFHQGSHGAVTVTVSGVSNRPSITSVSAITTNTHETIVIQGSGFGNTFPQTATSVDGVSIDTVESATTPSIAIWDNCSTQFCASGWEWQAGHSGNFIGISLTSWSDTRIVISGFGTTLGPGTRNGSGMCTGPTTWTICVGDTITIGVWGPNNVGTGYYTLTVTQAATVSVSVTTSPAVPSGVAPFALSFTAHASGGAAPYTYSWSFGDETSGTGATVSHTYMSPGVYPSTVVATDSQGRIAGALVTVSVGATATCGTGVTCSVQTNATITTPVFVPSSDTLEFSATGTPHTVGFANVTIPAGVVTNIALLQVSVNGAPLPSSQVRIGTAPGGGYWVYFTFTFSTDRITIRLNPPASTTGGLKVTVSGPNGLLQGATVKITSGPSGQTLPAAATTAADGTVTFTGLSPGTYTYQVSSSGYSGTVTVTATVTAGQTQPSSATLSQAQPAAPAPTDYTLVYLGAGVAAIIVLAGVFLVLRRRRGSTRVTT